MIFTHNSWTVLQLNGCKMDVLPCFLARIDAWGVACFYQKKFKPDPRYLPVIENYCPTEL